MDDTYRYYKVVDYNEDLNCPYTSEVYFVNTKSETCHKSYYTVTHSQGRIDASIPATSIPFI